LLTGVPIKDLACLEIKTLALLDYRLIAKEKDFEQLMRGDVDGLFI